jgi:hypothetical protein
MRASLLQPPPVNGNDTEDEGDEENEMELWDGLQARCYWPLSKAKTRTELAEPFPLYLAHNEIEATITGGVPTCSTEPHECEPGRAAPPRDCVPAGETATPWDPLRFPSMRPWTFVIFVVDVLVSLADWW